MLKKLWVWLWWGKPKEKTPIQKKQEKQFKTQVRIAQIPHRNKKRKGKK